MRSASPTPLGAVMLRTCCASQGLAPPDFGRRGFAGVGCARPTARRVGAGELQRERGAPGVRAAARAPRPALSGSVCVVRNARGRRGPPTGDHARVLRRPRWLRTGGEPAYPIRVLRNVWYDTASSRARRYQTETPLTPEDVELVADPRADPDIALHARAA